MDKEDSISAEQDTESRARRPWTPPRLVQSADVLDDVMNNKGYIPETGPPAQATSEPAS